MQYQLSPSRLSLMKDCPRCFWLLLNKNIKRPASVFPSLPSGMDRVLKAHFDSFRDKGELPPELKKENLGKDIRLFDDAELLKVWRDNRKGLRFTDSEGNVLMGAVDNILQKGEGKGRKLIVLDYKTRGYPCKDDTHHHYRDQMDIYNFLLRKNGQATEDYAYLLFYHPTSVNANGDVVFHTKLIKMDINLKNAEELFRKALELLKQKTEPQPAEACGWCGLHK